MRVRRWTLVWFVAVCCTSPMALLASCGGTDPVAPGTDASATIAFFLSLPGGSELWTVQPDGTQLARLTTGYNDVYPAWSRDHSKLAFTREPGDGSYGQIWVINPDGSGLRQLTNRPGAAHWFPAWSPDGGQIAFSGADSTTGERLFVMNADGTGLRQLTTNLRAASQPTWGPGGQVMVFVGLSDATSPRWHLFAVPMSGSSAPTQLTSGAGDDTSPAFSPDGREIAFISTRSGQTQIYVMNADGTNVRQLTHATDDVHHPAWSGDAKKITFSMRVGDNDYEIFVMDPDGSNLKNLTNRVGIDVDPTW